MGNLLTSFGSTWDESKVEIGRRGLCAVTKPVCCASSQDCPSLSRRQQQQKQSSSSHAPSLSSTSCPAVPKSPPGSAHACLPVQHVVGEDDVAYACRRQRPRPPIRKPQPGELA